MDKTLKENLKDTLSYFDNVIIGGETEEEYKNLEEFVKVLKKRNQTLKDSKTIIKNKNKKTH